MRLRCFLRRTSTRGRGVGLLKFSFTSGLPRLIIDNGIVNRHYPMSLTSSNIPILSGLKTCRLCQKDLRLHGKGLCNTCYARTWRQDNPEVARDISRKNHWRNRKKNNQRSRAYYQQHRKAQLEKQRQWYYKNKKSANSSSRIYRLTHREKLLKYLAAWKKRNLEKLEIYKSRQKLYNQHYRSKHLNRKRLIMAQVESRRRAQKRKTQIEPISFLKVFERDKGICGICGEPVEWRSFSLDHIVPLAKGGSHLYSNVQTSHLSCNFRKGHRIKL